MGAGQIKRGVSLRKKERSAPGTCGRRTYASRQGERMWRPAGLGAGPYHRKAFAPFQTPKKSKYKNSTHHPNKSKTASHCKDRHPVHEAEPDASRQREGTWRSEGLNKKTTRFRETIKKKGGKRRQRSVSTTTVVSTLSACTRAKEAPKSIRSLPASPPSREKIRSIEKTRGRALHVKIKLSISWKLRRFRTR